MLAFQAVPTFSHRIESLSAFLNDTRTLLTRLVIIFMITLPIMQGCSLFYFTSPEDFSPRGVIPIELATVAEGRRTHGVVDRRDKYIISITVHHSFQCSKQVYLLSARSSTGQEDWLQVLILPPGFHTPPCPTALTQQTSDTCPYLQLLIRFDGSYRCCKLSQSHMLILLLEYPS